MPEVKGKPMKSVSGFAMAICLLLIALPPAGNAEQLQRKLDFSAETFKDLVPR